MSTVTEKYQTQASKIIKNKPLPQNLDSKKQNMSESILKEELLKTYDIYIEGFKKNDMSLINSIIKFPIAILKDGKIEMLDFYPINPKKLKIEKEWDHSTDWKFEITAINENNAHINASAIRRKVDGSYIEKVSAFYGFYKIESDWKMCSFSEIIS